MNTPSSFFTEMYAAFDYGPVLISPHMTRLTCHNAGFMTAAGTNTYLLHDVNKQYFVVVDPGPDDAAHIEAIVQACGGAKHIMAIVVTHMHPDHSPAALPLQVLSGALIYGAAPVLDEYQDTTCQPDYVIVDNELLVFGEITLRCIHTPGHVQNHFCLLLENDDEAILLAGDHIMQGSTVVIIPPHGNMSDYILSLKKLLNYPISRIAAAHGLMIDTPTQEINTLVQHRLQREATVLKAAQTLRNATLEELLLHVYADVDPRLHAVAKYSLLAHLYKLEQEQHVAQQDGRWVCS